MRVWAGFLQREKRESRTKGSDEGWVAWWAHGEILVNEVSLFTICGVAFLAVFVLLITLAGVIRLITLAFPLRRQLDDMALVAAINAAAAAVYPGTRVTRIEEEK